ncbi:SGNH/GDSL hydrolase family protein, partial [Klebsiella pneumoniae]|uniref:SGNH/GDSL hydrolase family protein n=1 Tax=Klebsiella pneumoniae TaxID=573 RepID=UPI003C6D5075
MQRLHGVGARKFVVVGIGAIGCIPSQRAQNKSEECNGEVNFGAKNYNDGLKSVLQAFKSELKDINYSFFDAYAAFLNFIQNPA